MGLEMVFTDSGRRFVLHTRPLLVKPADDGLFAPDSVIRRVYSDSVCMLGSGTALLLQLAHPSIALGVHEHSDYENRPIDRLFGTLMATTSVVFGSRQEAEGVRAAMRHVHARVTGPGYRALDPELLCWVNATLLGTAADLYIRIIGPLTNAEKDELARDSRLVAEVFGCPVEGQPATWSDFQSYWDRMVSSLQVSATARRVAQSLLAGRGLPLRPAWMPPLAVARAVTAATLPPHIRRGYGLPWGRRDQALAAMTLSAAGAVLPRLPDRWRQVTPGLFRTPPPAHAGAAAA